MRRLPVFIVVDTSGSMRGEPMEAVRAGLQALVASLRQDPYALETVWLSLITFNRTAEQAVPLTHLEEFELPEIEVPSSGATHLGLALELLYTQVTSGLRKGTGEQRGDWRPMVFLMTDGKASDLYRVSEIAPLIRTYPFAGFIACAAGPGADTSQLAGLTDTVVVMDTMDGKSFQALFQWVSASVKRTTGSVGINDRGLADILPPPPPEVVVIPS